ncbi:uncharacterized protein LOC106647042 [Copidosoma floridanum]|uniref:uncharacterized protein LOC106647042 n=1 Tax=Copidosoma floridanum TaxID=29053 RepID=UPI0006C99821|nr:uncharacterized protein LOC106647042 [Copidosoma floridanum]
MVVLTRQEWFGGDFCLNVAGEAICASPVVRYLGVWVDSQLTFWEHIKRADDKDAKEAKRWLLASVSNSILLYGVEVWADAVARRNIQKRLISVQRIGSLGIACPYRTVSSAAVMVISRTISVVLLALEWRRKFLGSDGESDGDRREKTLTTWQQDWDRASVGR